MTLRTSANDLLHADVALGLGLADGATVARALQARWDGVAPSVMEALGLEADGRRCVEDEVARLVAMAGGDADAALSQRGGLDRTIHETVKPATSQALQTAGVGTRAPLQVMDPKRYRDFSLIGKGGMGVVYLALDTELNRRVALKMVRPDPGGPVDGATPTTPLEATPPSLGDAGEDVAKSFQEAKTRFLQEAWITGAMEHPGVLPVYELGQTHAGIPYYTMRYVRGERTLKNALAEATDTESRLALVEPFLRICDTLHYAHSRGVIHRDLKPENIGLGSFGDVLVLDWGLSKSQGQPDITQSFFSAQLAEYRDATDLQTVAGVLGTPGYMAPEAAIGKAEAVDAQSDVYSLGALLFQILTGQLPHKFETFVEFVARVTRDDPPRATEIDPTVPDALADACHKALAREKEDRFATAGDLADAVRHWLTEGRVDAKAAELVDMARAEIQRATEIGGNAGVWHLDRATAACTRALALRPGHPESTALAAQTKRTRESGIRAQITTGRRRVLAIGAFIVVGVAAVVALSIAKAFADKGVQSEREKRAVQREADEAGVAQRRAETDRDRAHARLANGFAATTRAFLETGRVAAAQVAAARGLDIAATPRTWRALAHADARWSPALLHVRPDAGARHLVFSLDGTRLFATHGDRRVLAYPMDGTGAPAELGRLTSKAMAMALSPSGSHLAVGEEAGRIRVWNLKSGGAAVDLPRRLTNDSTPTATTSDDLEGVRKGSVALALLFQDDSTLVGAYADKLLRVWSIKNQALAGNVGFSPYPVCTMVPAFGNDRGFWIGTTAGTVTYQKGRATRTPPNQRTPYALSGVIAALIPAPDGLFAASLDHRAEFFASDDRGLQVFQADAPRATALLVRTGLQPSGKGPALQQILSSAIDGQLRIWDLQVTKPKVRFELGSPASAMALNEATGLLATAHTDGTLRIWSLRTRPAAGRPVADVLLVLPDEKQLVVALDHGVLAVHDLASPSVRRHRNVGRASCLTAIRGGPPVTGALDGTIRYHDERGPTLRAPDPVTALARVDADPDALFSGDCTGRILAWRRRQRRHRKVATGDGFPIAAMAASRDGTRLAAGDVRGIFRVWDAARGESLDERTFTGPIMAAAISPDGRWIAAQTGDGRIRAWSLGDDATERSLDGNDNVRHLAINDDGDVSFFDSGLREFSWKHGVPAARTMVGKLGTGMPAAFARAPTAWAHRDSRRRLIKAENRYRMKMDGFTIQLVPSAESTPDARRVAPWSK